MPYWNSGIDKIRNFDFDNADRISEVLYFKSVKEKWYKLDNNGNIGNNCSIFLSFKLINDNDRRLINSFNGNNERNSWIWPGIPSFDNYNEIILCFISGFDNIIWQNWLNLDFFICWKSKYNG